MYYEAFCFDFLGCSFSFILHWITAHLYFLFEYLLISYNFLLSEYGPILRINLKYFLRYKTIRNITATNTVYMDVYLT